MYKSLFEENRWVHFGRENDFSDVNGTFWSWRRECLRQARIRFHGAVDPRILETLLGKFPDFERAHSESGLTTEEFDSLGATRRTLRQFIAGCMEMNALVRDIILPNPDTE